ncbi:aminopeptidase P family protein [Pseudemcibacter aquimaris]|uniref:aminopeptidase P family protein n=1 Tax=Pseudemcibacter aquimaris TaxID=2857064 RepID=UPI002013C05C|nr:aminopeptidase P family protein [Pseudemcibacter aquimaris]MCC3862024.1 aminopeptidase P family protein [Pseudemcibacter aquimaris]WDU58776.1 aminopeptidase P family protein [Pseudemcibacter aquimaris]
MDNKLSALRQKMRDQKLNGFLVPHTDEHQSEYTPGYAKRIAWLTGFKGSAGLVSVTLDQAAIYVDGRYTLQVRDQVDMKLYQQMKLYKDKPEDWFSDVLNDGDVVGFDPWLHDKGLVKNIREKLAKNGIELKAVSENPIDEIWQDRPEPSKEMAVPHDIQYAGETSKDKRKRLAKIIKEKQAEAQIITTLDSIAWLLNIRGSDVDCTPLVLSFAILKKNGKAELFIDPDKLDDDIKNHLGDDVKIYAKDQFESALKKLGAKKKTVLVDPKRSHVAIFDVLEKAGATIIDHEDPCQLDKAQKNDVELDGCRAAHVRDAVAVCKFLRWIDENAASGEYDELDAVEKLYEYRQEVSLFKGNSFETISGAGSNGAIVHYNVKEASPKKLEDQMLYLVDSGGQYLDGTTDITRTIAIGDPTEEQRDNFTRVLKGHIALAQARWPVGRTGAHLDTLARKSLWDVGLDYDHGTGHGVGSYLGVHEGPQNISPLGHHTPLKAGMILSNEPGFYKTGEYGIRIENLVIVRNSNFRGQDRPMQTFETVTLVPIDTRLVNAHMMTAAEITWLNIYHAKVREEIGPLLDGEDKEWLMAATESITTL